MTHARPMAEPVHGAAKGPKTVLFSLQYLRAIAAFMVIYFHAVLQVRLFAGDQAFLPLIGAGGVDIFFALSGFMMWYTIEQAPVGAGEFFRRRIVRIVPLYWAITMAALAVACVVPSLLRSTVFDLRHAVASLLFVPWANPALAATGPEELFVPVIIPGWTLNFEMLFYLFFGLTLWSAKPLRLPLLGLMLLGLYWISGLVGTASPLSFYHKDMLFEFLAGAILGALHLERRPLPGAVALCVIVAAFAVMLGIELADGTPSPRIVLFGIPALLILIAALRAEASHSVPSWPLLNELGNASFSTYLTHGFVLAGLRVVVAKLGLGSGAVVFQIGFVLVSLAVAPVIGLATYRRVELPLVRLAGRWLARRGARRPLQVA
jgi:exopolysaccharide production protein ExoZ